MVKRNYNLPDSEPEQSSFEKPSETEHLFQVTNIHMPDDEMGKKLKLDEDSVSVECEVVGGKEEGRTLLQRLTLDESAKGFFATRIFLKAIGEEHKGQIEIDTDRWIGRQFYATVVHSGKYANIDQYNFDKKIEQQYQKPLEATPITPDEIEWDEK